MFLNLFQFLTRLLNSKHLKLFSTYLVGRHGTMWKTCFYATQNAKKENQLKHKNQEHKRLFIDSYVLEYEELYLSLRGDHIKDKLYININKNNENLKIFCLQAPGYLNTRKSFPICMFVVMASGKCDLHIHSLFYKNSKLHTNDWI